MLVAWFSGRTSVFGRRAFTNLRSTCSKWVTTYVGKPSAIGQPTRPTQPFILSERQAWCYLQVKQWSMREHFVCTSLAKKVLYKYSSFPVSFHVPLTGRRTTESVMHGKCSTRPPVITFLAKGHSQCSFPISVWIGCWVVVVGWLHTKTVCVWTAISVWIWLNIERLLMYTTLSPLVQVAGH